MRLHRYSRWDGTQAAFTLDAEGALDALSELLMEGLDAEQALASPHVLIGTVEGLCEELLARRERHGISHVVVPPRAIDAFAPVVARLAGR